MEKNQKQILIVLGIIVLLVSLFLWREIKNYKSISTEIVSEPLVAETATVLPITADDQVLGNPGAALTIVEYINLSDSKSKRLNSDIMEFVNKNPLKARAIFKHATVAGFFDKKDLPNRAAWCAGKQKKLWEYIELLDINKNTIKTEALKTAAKNTKLNLEMWQACFDGEKSANAVASETEEARRLTMGKPPLIFVNYKKINTDLDFDLKEFLSSLIAE
jgi:protein-disulfide isomerase